MIYVMSDIHGMYDKYIEMTVGKKDVINNDLCNERYSWYV